MAAYAEGEEVIVGLSARDCTGALLFAPPGSDEDGYCFPYEPPFFFTGMDEDGDLIVTNDNGDFLAVSPQFVALEAPLEPDDEPEEDPVRQPGHYKGKGGMEAIDVIEAFDLNYRLGNSAKYLLRAGKKGGEVDATIDLRKAMAYINREINAREGGAAW